jgi:hypothetical protein
MARTLTGTDVSLGSLSARVRPTSSPHQQLLPLLPTLEALLPGGGLPRGAVVEIEAADGAAGAPGSRAPAWTVPAGGATTLAFSLLAAATRAGCWCAAVGVADVGVVALAEMGVDLDHLALVPHPGTRWGEAVALLLDGMDAVLVCPPGPVRPALARRLAARARERRVALVVLSRQRRWPESAELRLTVEAAWWAGAGRGDGHLQGRRVELVVGGRRAASRPIRTELWLPASSGAPAP